MPNKPSNVITSNRIFTCSGRILMVHVLEQTEKNPNYIFTVKQISKELQAPKIYSLYSMFRRQLAYNNIKVITEEKKKINNTYQITKKGIDYAEFVRKEEGLPKGVLQI